MKKILIIMLVFVMVLSVCGACANDTESNKESTKDNESSKDSTSVLSDNLPDDLNYDGYSFRVLTYQYGNEGGYAKYFAPAEESDSVSTAAIRRNMYVEERLGCEIVCNELDYGYGAGVYNLIYTALMDGEDICDVADIHICESITGLLTLGGLCDYRTMTYVDFNQPWYVQGFNEIFNIHGTQYLISGAFNNSTTMPLVTFFNKDMVSDLGLELPYEFALNGTWTLDKFIEYMANTYSDIDGEMGETAGDRYGCADLFQSYAYMCSGFGIDVVQKGDDDELTLNLYSEKLVNVVTKLNELVWNNPNVYQGDGITAFKEGRALFNTFLSGAVAMRNIEGFTYGILPMPKWDESQENYVTYSPASYLVTPSTVEDPDRTGAILEALNSASYTTFRAAVTENLIEQKILLSPEDVDVYNMVIDNQYIEFARYLPFAPSIRAYQHIVGFLKDNNNNVASWAEANQGVIKDAFDMFYEYLGA